MNKEKLLNKNFVLLWQGMAFSVFGDVLYSMAIGVWVYEKTGSSAWMGIFSSISMFTTMFLMPFAGPLIDRWNKRNILVVCDLIRGVLMIVVGIIALTGNMTLEMVLITAFVAAVCNVFFSPASMTMFTSVVAPKFLVQAQSLSSGTNNLIRLVGKGLSGALVVMLGVPLIILINGISLLISAVTEVFIQIPTMEKPKESLSIKLIFNSMTEGMCYILSNRGLAILMVGALLCNLFGSGFYAMILPFSELKGMNLTQYGLFSSVASLAGLVGTLLTGIVPIKEKHQFIITMSTMMISTFIGTIGYVYIEGFIPLCIICFIAQVLNSIGNTLFNAKLLLAADESIRGRAVSIFMPFSQGGQAISSVAYGFLSEIFNLYQVTIVGGILSLIVFSSLSCSKSVKKIFS